MNLIRTIDLLPFDGNCISICGSLLFVVLKFAKKANMKINLYKNRQYLRKMFGKTK